MGSEFVSAELIDLHDLRVMVLQPTVDLRIPYLTSFVRDLEKRNIGVEKIAKILLKVECWLSDVVCLQNVELTRAFLREKDSTSSNEDADCFVPPEVVLLKNLRLKAAFGNMKDSTIDGDSRASVDRVMTCLDVQNAEVILKYDPDKDNRVRHFFNNIVTMATKHLNLKVLEVFVKQIVEWNILNDEASRLIEHQVFRKADKQVIQIFLECRIEDHIVKSFKRNVLTALFGNRNMDIGFLKKLKLDPNARGSNDLTALHYAVQSSLVDNVKFLLDCGAEPNSMNWKNETPLILTLCEPQVNSIDNKQCAELLLQHGADPFLRSWEGRSFDSCIHSNDTSSECASSKYLIELVLAYVCLHELAGAANLSANNANALNDIDISVKQNDDLFSFYMRCKQQLQLLRKDKIRDDLTMFTIITKTGDNLIRALDEKDRRVITGFMDKYSKETLHPYYLNALQEHMRQFRKLLTCQNRAMLVISERAKTSAPCKVLNKIIDNLTGKDLLMFQSGCKKLTSGPSGGQLESRVTKLF